MRVVQHSPPSPGQPSVHNPGTQLIQTSHLAKLNLSFKSDAMFGEEDTGRGKGKWEFRLVGIREAGNYQ